MLSAQNKRMAYHARSRCALTVVAGIFAASLAGAEEKDKPAAQKTDPQMAEMMKKVEAAGTPGQAHKALEPLVGNWSAVVKCWTAPDAPPTVTKATAKATWVMKGRFVQEEFAGEFMGKPFRGLGFTGYDNMKQKYNNVWIDDLHTSVFATEGAAGSDPKAITFTGKMDCPMTDEKDLPTKQILHIVSRDKRVLEMYDPTKGNSFKSMEITYTRK